MSTRNCLFLALDESDLLLAAGLLLAWSRGFVEPVAAPPEPRHITAQQLLALCLQEGRVGERTWQEWRPLRALRGGPALVDVGGLPCERDVAGPPGRPGR